MTSSSPSPSSSPLEQASSKLTVARSVVNDLNSTFIDFQSQALSILSLSEQWRTYQRSFAMIEASLSSFVTAMESKERETEKNVEVFERVESVEKSVSEMMRAVEMREKEVREGFEVLEMENRRVRDRCSELEVQEKRLSELEVKAKEFLEDCRAMEERERRILERESRMCECECCCRGVETVETRVRRIRIDDRSDIEDRSRRIEPREREVDERCRGAEVKEKRLNEWCEVRKKEMRERQEGLESREERVDERLKAIELREREVEERCRGVEVKEKRLNEGLRGLESKRREIDERLKVIELREREVDEHCRGVEVKEKRLNDGLQGLELKGREIGERWEALELNEKQVSECRRVLELREKDMNEGIVAVRSKLKQIDEGCKGMMIRCSEAVALREKQMNECIEKLELKAREVAERCKEVELREKQMARRSRALDWRDQKFDERCQGVELKEKEINEHLQALKLKEKQVDECCQVLESREMQMNERRRAFETEMKRMSECCDGLMRKCYKAFVLREKQMNECIQKLELKAKRVAEWCTEVELKEKEINERYQEVELREELVNRSSRELDLRDQGIIDRSQELELNEKQIVDHCQALESTEKQISELSKAQESKVNQIDDCCSELEFNEKQISEHCEAIELKERQVVERCNVVELRSDNGDETQLRNLCMGMSGKVLQSFLNERVDEHDSMGEKVGNALKLSADPPKLVLAAIDGFFPSHLNPGNVAYEASSVRSSGVLLLEQLMLMKPIVSETVRKEAVKMASEWREKMWAEGESELVVLGFLLLLVTYNLESSFDGNEIRRLYEMVDQHRVAPQLCLKLGLSEREHIGNSLAQRKTEQSQPESLQGAASSSIGVSSGIDLLCRNMDSIGVRSYLIDHVEEHFILHDELLTALRLASDPAKLVLDVTRSFYQSDLDNVPGDGCKANCAILLIQLLKLRAHITPHVKEEASKFTTLWRCSLGSSPLEIFSFLQFLASYRLTRSYKEEELLSLFGTLCNESDNYWLEQSLQLYHALRLAKKIPGLIQSLIRREEQLLAVRCICAFKMEDAFPPVPHLKDYLDIIRKRVEELVKNTTESAQADAANIELTALRDILACITYFKLESDYLSKPLVPRVKQLEKEIKLRQTSSKPVSKKPVKLPNKQFRVKKSRQEKEVKKEEVHDPAKVQKVVGRNTDSAAFHSRSHSDSQDGKRCPVTPIVSPRQDKRPRFGGGNFLKPHNRKQYPFKHQDHARAMHYQFFYVVL